MSNSFLNGKNAVVTGASRGIGAAIAAALAEAGAAVLVAARSQAGVEKVASGLRERGFAATATVCDVSDPASVETLAETARATLSQVDILVNNAGIATSAPLHHQSLEEWNRVMAVNATGTFLCTRAFAPAMAQRGWGRVINVASVAARTGARYIGAYAASKHAVLGFTRSIAAEMAEKGVTVNAICPGYVDTDMTAETVSRIVEKTGLSIEEARESILKTTPQHRLIEPDEVAHAVLALCPEAARGINGQAILIDGGEILS